MTTPEISFSPFFLVWTNNVSNPTANKEPIFISYHDYYGYQYVRRKPLVYQVGSRIEAVRIQPQLQTSSLHLRGGGWIAIWEQNTIVGFKAFCAATPCQKELKQGLVFRDYGDLLYPICPTGHERYVREYLLNMLRKFEITEDGRVVFGNLRKL